MEAEVGRGGLARVYRVRHKNLDTLHALKVLSLGGGELRERLLREGRVQSQLDHPNIVPVRDVIDLAEGPALLMDYIDGPTLDRWTLEEQPAAADKERVFMEILEGVDFAHGMGVIHRDLKPGNVMMELRRGVWHPRVADFGLAKMIDGDEPGALQSHTGRPMGTPAYMSPEQVRSAKNVDRRTDVFALGCILYELVCNQRAFVGEDTLEVFNRVTQGRYRPPRELVRGLEPRLEAALLGALAIQPDERIPDCATLAQVIRGELPWARPSAIDVTMDGSTFDDAPRPAPTLSPLAAGNTLNFTGTVTMRPDGAAIDGVLTPAPARRWGLILGIGVVLAAGTGMLLAAVLLGWLAGSAGGQTAVAPPASAVSGTPGAGSQPGIPALSPDSDGTAGSPPGTSASPSGSAASPGSTQTGAASPGTASPGTASPGTASPGTASPGSVVSSPGSVQLPPGKQVSRPGTFVSPATPVAAASPQSASGGAAGPVPVAESQKSRVGTVTIAGDARSVRLRTAEGARFSEGEVPPGSYLIEASFDAGPPMHAGNLVVRAGQRVRLDCQASTSSCSQDVR